MQAPSISDPSFKAFLEKLQEQNNRGFASQLIQLKAERENAGEDNDKREKQLDDVISSLKEVRLAVTGVKLDVDLTPLVNIGENQTKLLEELSKEASLTRKLTEGSVEYDKEAAQYRNTSGRDIESKVSGKTSKQGGFIDFETARDTLSGQGKRVKEDNAFSLKPINYTPGKAAAAAVGGRGSPAGGKEEEDDKSKYQGLFKELESGFKFFMTDGLSEKPGQGIFQTPSKEVEKKEEKDKEPKVSNPRQENPEADNVVSTGEIQADAAKSDLELSKQMLDTTKAQLVELKAIREALAPKTPKDLVEQKSGPTTGKEKESEGGGSLLGDLASGAMDLMGSGKKAAGKVAGKAAGIGSKLAKFATSNTGKVLGSVAAVGLGAYTAYEGYTAAEDSKQAKMEEVQAKVDSGEMKPEEAAAARKEIGNTATVEKSGAVGEGTGMAAGAIAGASLGAAIGSIVPGVGTAIGGLAGGALGAFAGSKAGKFVGEKVGSGINAVKGFFGGSTDTPGAATKETLAPAPATGKEEEDVKFKKSRVLQEKIGGSTIAGYEKGYELNGKKEDVEAAEVAWKKFGEAERSDDKAGMDAAANEFTQLANKINSPEYKAKMKEISDKQNNKKEEKVTGGPGAKTPSTTAAPSADTKATPVVEKKSVDTAAAGKATVVAPKETVDGKKVKPVTDVDKAQQAAKEKYQASTSEEKAASEKLKAFEKENQFDYREKPTATQDFLEEPGTGKFKDPKKQEEYDKLKGAKQQASESKRSAGAAYTAAEGVTKTQVFTGGEQPSKPGDKGGIQGKIDSEIGGMQSDGAKIEALKKRGYTDKDLGRDDTLKQNFIQMSDGAKYPNKNLGLYEAVVKKELDAPIDAKTKDGQVIPNETVDGKPATDAKAATPAAPVAGGPARPRSLDEIAMAEAKKGGRATPNISDKKAAQQIAQKESLDWLTAPDVTEGGKISNTGKDVAKTSTENVDMGREAGKGGANNTVVSNNVSSNNTTKFVPMKANPRPEYTGSSLDRYTNRITVY